MYLVREAFVNASVCRNCTEEYSSYSYDTSSQYTPSRLELLWSQSRNGSLERLESAECITAYAIALQSDRRNLLLVMDNAQANTSPYNRNLTYINNTDTFWFNTFSAYEGTDPDAAPDSYAWICSGLEYKRNTPCANRLGEIAKAPDAWTVGQSYDGKQYSWPVKYCLSEPAVPRCRLHFSPAIAAIVTVLNLCK